MVILAEHKQVFHIPKIMQSASIYFCTKESQIDKLIVSLEIGSIQNELIIVANDLSWLKETFFGHFKIIQAGGGYVLNAKNEVLMMFRNGKWDLPKGKIEKNEDVKEGAIREVEEETNVKVKNVTIRLGSTFHTYNLKNKRILKESVWYLMLAKSNNELIPQLEEGIELVQWTSMKEAKKLLKNSYNSIQEVFDLAESHSKAIL